jgi:hypothetical protein
MQTNTFQYPSPLLPTQILTGKIVPNLAPTLKEIPWDSTAVEVGVRLGDITEILLRQPTIAKLWLMDHFDLHSSAKDNASRTLGGQQHLPYIRNRFSEAIKKNRLETRIGRLDAIKGLPGRSASAIFLRGCKEFSSLLNELYMCDSKLRPGGMIWVADYIMADYTTGEKYEVVRAVNDFTRKAGYNLAFLVLDHTMFCTVVLRKPS